MYDFVIIGSGLSGLQCGALLSKEGYNVCVLEKNDRIGGMIQSFVRDGVVFNTGLNYTESLGEGEVLYKYFKLFGLIGKLNLKQLDLEQSELITIRENEYKIPQGHDNYVEALSSYFPDEAKGIEQYVNGLKDVCESFPLYKLSDEFKSFSDSNPYWEQSTSGYINSHVSNPELRGVLAGINILYAGIEDVTALYTHALINYSFIKSSWRVMEGGSGIANVLASGIKQNGGTIKRNAEACHINIEDGLVNHIDLKSGEIIRAKNVISSVHPKTLLNIVTEGAFKKVYRNRILSQKDSIGMFSVYIVLKRNAIRYQNYNHHFFKDRRCWTTDEKEWPMNCLMYTPYNHQTNSYANGFMIISYMKYSEVAKWANTTVENRGEEYEVFKKVKAEELIDFASKKIPNLRASIHSYYTSTPLTYRDYTGSFQGSAYGIIKDCKNPVQSIFMPNTRIKNLFFTGQNLNMHGILGVSISSFLTCSTFLGEEYLYKKLIDC